MATEIVGLDLSLTSTGVATLHINGVNWSNYIGMHSIKSKPFGDKWESRNVRLNDIVHKVLMHTHTSSLIVVEGPSYGSKYGSAFDRAGLWWQVYSQLSLKGHPIAVVQPTQRMKWATGKGKASKEEVKQGVVDLWSTAGKELAPSNDDEADALCFATMGAQWLGLDVPYENHQGEVLDKVYWPSGGIRYGRHGI